MSGAPCPRQFEVEAMRDGRLGEVERASFGRHLTACAACAREARALDALAGALRSDPGRRGHADELHRWRERTRLLRAFDGSLVARRPVAPKASWAARKWLVWPVAVSALVAGLAILTKVRLGAPPAPPVLAASIQADQAAVWSRDSAPDNRERVVLQRGTLSIRVDHASFTGRLQVVLPDGELEDTGTTFTVSVEDGRTVRVAVAEGSVVLRLRGQPALAIAAGATWVPPGRSLPPIVPVSAPALGSAAPRALAPPPLAATAPPARGSRHRDPSLTDAAVDFRAAMALLRAGDGRGAAAAFAAFRFRYPADARAEDAAYLRVIALQRAGADGEVQRAAREYLQLYPRGFRRADVESLRR